MIGLITVYPIVSNSIIINISIMIGLMEFIPEYHPLLLGFTTLKRYMENYGIIFFKK